MKEVQKGKALAEGRKAGRCKYMERVKNSGYDSPSWLEKHLSLYGNISPILIKTRLSRLPRELLKRASSSPREAE